MARFSRKDKTAEIVKGVMDELNKAGAPMAMAMQSGQLQGSPVQTGVPVMAQQVVAATPLSRPMSAFGAAFNPGTPLFPGAIDPVNPVTGRAEPRITQYQVAENLMITQEPAPFGKLEWAARNVDIISRCITIRIDDITKMAWSFEISDDAVAEIMAEENCSHAKASTIARDKYADQVAKMTEAFANPFPLEYKNWRSWISQAMWDYLVYDEVVVYPNYNLGGECFGFDLIDPSTIKILRDDKGRVPQWPLPGFQQILWGYPRGEFTASPLNEVNAQFNSLEQRGPVRPSDSLNVFIGHPQTKMLYGFSAVEQCLQYTDLYVNRQEWLLAEYKAGSTPAMFLETDSALELWQLADNDRILNDYYSGMTQNRQQIRSLPGGAKVVQTNQIDEKYKSDYDEFIAKRIAAIFGVSPSQVGVVARAGLGGGKGAQEGETASAETVSTKPTINFIVDMVNTLCRQHLGMDESLTFSLTDDTSSSDQMNKYKALSTAVNAGMLTLNDSRGELGMPLFDSAEADEPFVLTATGPVFFNGQLSVDTSGETIGQTGPSSDQTNQDQVSQGKEEPSVSEGKASPDKDSLDEAKSVQTEELKEFARFVKSRNKTGKWRAFDFVAINEELADKLNNDAYFLVKGTVPMPKSVLEWAEDVVKAQISDTPKGLLTKGTDHENRIKALASKHKTAIASALAASITGVSTAISHAVNTSTMLDAPMAAKQAVDAYINFDSATSVKTLQSLYTVALDAGANAEAKTLGADAILGPRAQQLIQRAGVTIKGINDTTQNRIYTAIRDGVANGDAHDSITTAVNAIVDDPDRADIIATTETNRAYQLAAQDVAAGNGAIGFNWITDSDPCPECIELESANPHDISELVPPDHPNCPCDTKFIYPSLTGE